MATQDDRTEYLDLPLPHRDNDLSVDVERLRTSFTEIDSKIEEIDGLLGDADSAIGDLESALEIVQALLESDDSTLDTLQELVDEIKNNRSSISEILGSRYDAEESQTLEDGQTDVDLEELSDTDHCTVFIEGIRLSKDKWAPHESIPTRLVLAQSYPAGTEITVVRQGGV